MSDERYVIVSPTLVRRRILIRRRSDGLVARCKPSYLIAAEVAGEMMAKSDTKELALDNLEWSTEGTN